MPAGFDAVFAKGKELVAEFGANEKICLSPVYSYDFYEVDYLHENNRSHYQRIIVALSETIHLMSEIDAVIEKNGGWPLK